MKKTFIIILLVLFSAFPFSGIAQQSASKKVLLEDLYKNYIFNPKGISAARWMKDSKGYLVLEKNEAVGGRDVVKYDVETGQREIFVPASKLIPNGKKTPLAISNYAWSADNTKMLIFTNTRKVWRYHTRGDYWVLDLKNDKLTQIGANLESASLMFTKFSPDATKVAFVYKNNIYVQSLINGKLE